MTKVCHMPMTHHDYWSCFFFFIKNSNKDKISMLTTFLPLLLHEKKQEQKAIITMLIAMDSAVHGGSYFSSDQSFWQLLLHPKVLPQINNEAVICCLEWKGGCSLKNQFLIEYFILRINFVILSCYIKKQQKYWCRLKNLDYHGMVINISDAMVNNNFSTLVKKGGRKKVSDKCGIIKLFMWLWVVKILIFIEVFFKFLAC